MTFTATLHAAARRRRYRRGAIAWAAGLGLWICCACSGCAVAPEPARVQATAAPAADELALQRVTNEQRRWTQRIAEYRAAHDRDPLAPIPLYNLGVANARAGGRDLQAMAWFQAYLTVAPRASNARKVRNAVLALEARAAADAERFWSAAETAAAEIERSTGRSVIHRQAGWAAAWAGDAERAAAFVERLDPLHRAFYLQKLAVIQLEIGHLGGAAWAARQLAPPDRIAAYRSMAAARRDAGDFAKARQLLELAAAEAEAHGDAPARAKLLDRIAADRQVTEAQAVEARVRDHLAFERRIRNRRLAEAGAATAEPDPVVGEKVTALRRFVDGQDRFAYTALREDGGPLRIASTHMLLPELRRRVVGRASPEQVAHGLAVTARRLHEGVARLRIARGSWGLHVTARPKS